MPECMGPYLSRTPFLESAYGKVSLARATGELIKASLEEHPTAAHYVLVPGDSVPLAEPTWLCDILATNIPGEHMAALGLQDDESASEARAEIFYNALRKVPEGNYWREALDTLRWNYQSGVQFAVLAAGAARRVAGVADRALDDLEVVLKTMFNQWSVDVPDELFLPTVLFTEQVRQDPDAYAVLEQRVGLWNDLDRLKPMVATLSKHKEMSNVSTRDWYRADVVDVEIKSDGVVDFAVFREPGKKAARLQREIYNHTSRGSAGGTCPNEATRNVPLQASQGWMQR